MHNTAGSQLWTGLTLSRVRLCRRPGAHTCAPNPTGLVVNSRWRFESGLIATEIPPPPPSLQPNQAFLRSAPPLPVFSWHTYPGGGESGRAREKVAQPPGGPPLELAGETGVGPTSFKTCVYMRWNDRFQVQCPGGLTASRLSRSWLFLTLLFFFFFWRFGISCSENLEKKSTRQAHRRAWQTRWFPTSGDWTPPAVSGQVVGPVCVSIVVPALTLMWTHNHTLTHTHRCHWPACVGAAGDYCSTRVW